MKHGLSHRPIALFLAAFLFSGCSVWGQDHFPGKNWDEVKNPEEYGYFRAKLVLAKSYAETIDTAAVLIKDRNHPPLFDRPLRGISHGGGGNSGYAWHEA